MNLVKDQSPGARAISVPCIGERHHELKALKYGSHPVSTMFTLAQGYADLDGKAFHDYYCDACASALDGEE